MSIKSKLSATLIVVMLLAFMASQMELLYACDDPVTKKKDKTSAEENVDMPEDGFGKEVAGFRMSISIEKTNFLLGESIILTTVIKNVSDKDKKILGSKRIATLQLVEPFLTATITKKVEGEEGEEFSYINGEYVGSCAGKQHNYVVKTKKEVKKRIRLIINDRGQLMDNKGKPTMNSMTVGEYTIQFEYTGIHGELLFSNLLTVTVEEEKDEEAEAGTDSTSK